ncbi:MULTISPECIES: type II toxin-antitoxin system RelE/ParE family toxin [Endozoicomonas]|uniref:type II toxin-antitoxin system RelE/ParE family toxin n=1 Tax=Endozoicomonas TaxID=305899 RepID=UPI0013D4B60D|nr:MULTISPECIES: type II toxin-antitoxin system RelE/ParE family toxin [Endozoicomonas]
MEFVEASVFTKIITQLMSDDDYRAMQEAMIAQPDIGSVIKGTGGLRKFRWKLGDSGKRGGVRTIYYWQVSEDIFYMLYAYTKSRQTDLTSAEKKVLSELAREFCNE